MPSKLSPTTVLLALALSLSACSSDPQAGDDCDKEDTLTCSSTTEALFCESGAFRAIPCRGTAGCTESSTQGTCDVSRARAGDACPKSIAGKAQCDVSNANQGLLCTNGVWTAEACKGCAVQAGNVVCQP
jgi:hypothetical protein